MSTFLLGLVFGVVAPVPNADTPSVPALVQKGAELFARGEFDLAIVAFDEALRVEPNNPFALGARGTAWFRKKEYQKAIRDTTDAVRIEPAKLSFCYTIRGSARYLTGEYDDAVKDFEKAISLDPGDLNALNGRAWAAAVCPQVKHRNDKKALEYAQRACEANEHKDPFYLGTLAAALAANGRYEEAVKWQTKALADAVYAKEVGEDGRAMLKQFRDRKPYREKSPRNGE